MWRTTALTIVAVTWGIMATDHEASAATKRRGAMIVSPKRNHEVERSHEVVGKLHVPGQPVVLVKPEQGDGTWWIQPTPTLSDRGYFTTEVRFGSSISRRGDKFSLMVIVLQSASDIEYLRDRDSLEEIPDTIWQSEEVPVVLGDDAKKDRGPVAISAVVLKPQADEKVKRVTELIGRVPEELHPIVLVGVDDSSGLWWVQDPVVMGKGGYFKSIVRFGNDATPDGTKFRILVVTPRSGQEASVLKTGMSLPDLPNGIPRSKEIVVQLERLDAKRAEGAE
ncbi:MAG: hypothetical protein H6821_06420 [Planctomycetaceae bacterium]|nr:hypothetical protein [Planctomycetales bacterium]MCB9873798.1 hypothetical protein [Planctomycetaceae bacterium]MCB9939711.1 hypothetical protein [Planctomycetaceae bacterium]HRX79430.1 hypothetical protein [Pirellulaceae bacterium]